MPATGRISVDGIVRSGGSRVSNNTVPIPAQSIHMDVDAGHALGEDATRPTETLHIGSGASTGTTVPHPAESVFITNT